MPTAPWVLSPPTPGAPSTYFSLKVRQASPFCLLDPSGFFIGSPFASGTSNRSRFQVRESAVDLKPSLSTPSVCTLPARLTALTMLVAVTLTACSPERYLGVPSWLVESLSWLMFAPVLIVA